MLHEQVRRDDGHAGPGERILLQHTARAAPVIGMGVREDHGGNRLHTAVLEVEIERGAGALGRGQGIHDDDTAVPLDQRHVGNVESAHLIDAGHDLEQAVLHVEPRLPPQAGIDRRWRLFGGQKAIGLEAPDRPPLRIRNLRVLDRAEEAARRVVKIPRVGKRQRIQHCRLLRNNGRRCVLRLAAEFGHRSPLPAACGYIPSSLGSHSDRPGQYVTTTRKASIVSSHGHTATVNSVIPILAMPDAT